jgi:hypothetical protein
LLAVVSACTCSRLNDRVKLVGPVISCVPVPSDHTNPAAPWGSNPHIPFHALATDRCVWGVGVGGS